MNESYCRRRCIVDSNRAAASTSGKCAYVSGAERASADSHNNESADAHDEESASAHEKGNSYQPTKRVHRPTMRNTSTLSRETKAESQPFSSTKSV